MEIEHSAVHVRWMKLRNRRQEDAGYQQQWWAQQCLHCAAFVPLSGVLSDDYGACASAESPFDGMVRFEHDGCDAFVLQQVHTADGAEGVDSAEDSS